MTEKTKRKRALKIADELDALGFKDVAESLRNALLSKEKGNAQTTDEGEGDGDEGDGNGSNHPPKKGGN